MARRNKKLIKLRHYRDKLIAKIVNLETLQRAHMEMFRETRRALQNEDTLRAYAIVSDQENLTTHLPLTFIEKNEAVAELTLVYKFLSIEREYTSEMSRAVGSRDLLRIAALCADHQIEQIAHDEQLATWGISHGFTRSLKDEQNNTIV